MTKFTNREKAQIRALMADETKPLKTDAQNMLDSTSGFRGEYPRMLYRQTEEEEPYVVTTHADGRPREVTIVNRFNGFLCETTVAEDADDAERLLADGWEISPSAAYGQTSAAAAAVTAKDAYIAELEDRLAAASQGASEEPTRRGPGRPRKEEVSEGV